VLAKQGFNIYAYLSIIRPINCFMIGLAVIVGQVVATSGKPDMLLLGEGFFTGFLFVLILWLQTTFTMLK